VRVTQVAAYLLVLVLAFELAVWEAFLAGARPFGTALPVSAVVAVVANVVLVRVGSRLVPAAWGPLLPGVLWLVVVLGLAVTRPEGDLVVASGVRGWALLLGGSIAIVISAALPRATPAGAIGR
jgi:hypothetical protein